jgi:hypothetical protein
MKKRIRKTLLAMLAFASLGAQATEWKLILHDILKKSV